MNKRQETHTKFCSKNEKGEGNFERLRRRFFSTALPAHSGPDLLFSSVTIFQRR
jgi:hypothetical protein